VSSKPYFSRSATSKIEDAGDDEAGSEGGAATLRLLVRDTGGWWALLSRVRLLGCGAADVAAGEEASVGEVLSREKENIVRRGYSRQEGSCKREDQRVTLTTDGLAVCIVGIVCQRGAGR